MKAPDWQTIPEIVRAARARLPQRLWDYSCGGAETETTLRRNRTAFDYLAFQPRVLRDVRGRDTSTTFLGHPLSLPVMFAPVGSIDQFNPDGALACARAAEHVGTTTFVSTMSAPSMEDVRAGAEGPLVFQIYVRGDRAWFMEFVHRIERAGFDAICLTVDSAAYGRRERDLRNRYLARNHPRPNLAGLPQGADRGREDYQAGLTWEDLAWLKDTTRLPVVVKGVMSAEDARIAAEGGADAVYVSNHGGRQLDHAPATLDVLPEIVAAVNGKAEVVVDSGFMRGTDVLKGLALGAKAVLVGKLMTWALGAGGEPGVERAAELLKTEMSTAMANIGIRSVQEIGPEYVRASYPPAVAPWPVGGPDASPSLGQA